MSKEKTLSFFIFLISLIFSISFLVFQDFFLRAKTLGLLGIFLTNLTSSASIFLPAPGFISVIGGGSIYNPLVVGIVASLGASIGEFVSYILGFSGRNILNHRLSKRFWFKVFEGVFHEYGGIILFSLSFIPNPLFDAVGIIAGVFKYPPKRFFIIVFFARALRFILLAFISSRIW